MAVNRTRLLEQLERDSKPVDIPLVSDLATREIDRTVHRAIMNARTLRQLEMTDESPLTVQDNTTDVAGQARGATPT